jgi:hypothetical protein
VGGGEAIAALRDLWFGPVRTTRLFGELDATIHGVELEKHRFDRASRLLASKTSDRFKDSVLEADAFHVEIIPEGGASLLFLNPPYDADPIEGRLEQRFLRRWTACLTPGQGVLVFLVPYYALKASASYLARSFTDLRAWRFPNEDFNFKQCVLLGRRRESELPANDFDTKRIEKWAESPDSMPVLETLSSPLYGVSGEHPGLTLKKLELDIQGLVESLHPWEDSSLFGTDRSVYELIGAPYPVALPPRPAHLALALSAGSLNGKRLEPDRPGLPPILVKASLRRDFVVVKHHYNRDGDPTGTLQVQRPKLTLHALRLDTLSFHEMLPGTSPSDARELPDFNSADLVTAYSTSLGRLMREQFPAIHDPSNPRHEIELPVLGREPYTIQKHLITAGLKLIALGENPFLTAEVGTGKSTVALAIVGCLSLQHLPHTRAQLERLGLDTSRLRPVHRTLILCPPHLLKSWSDQAAAVLPAHRVQIVRQISDLDRPAEIYLLSRETAKLGHALSGLSLKSLSPSRLPGATPRSRAGTAHLHTPQCPRCGCLVTTDPEELAATRQRCGNRRRLPTNPAARLAEDLALLLFPANPRHPEVVALIANCTMVQRFLNRTEGDENLTLGPPPSPEKTSSIARAVLRLLCTDDRMDFKYQTSALCRALVLLAQASGCADTLSLEARELAGAHREISRQAAVEGRADFSLPVSVPRQLAEELEDLARKLETLDASRSVHPLLSALESLRSCGTWHESNPCPEPLYQAVPQPRRFPLARYLTRHRHRLAANPDFLIIDEAQDYSTQGSAQEKAAHRLVETGIPTLALSGSLMGGKASSLFANFWALSRGFRQDFGRHEKQSFVTRYGYRAVFVPEGATAEAVVVGYGSKTDREERRESPEARQSREAPGLHPLFILNHLLPTSLIMHKKDLEAELPPYREVPVAIEIAEDDTTAKEMLEEHRHITSTLTHQISVDRYTKLAGVLWGAMSTLPSYLDRCTDDLPPFLLRYPDHAGGSLVAEGRLFPSAWRTPKERWMINRVRTCLAEGRRVLIFLLNTLSGLPARYLHLLREHLAEQAVFLDVAKVKAADREDWLNAKVIAPGRRILITHPKAVQTGLNNLVVFSHGIWMQGLDFDARVVRQANGRLHRIGQTLDVTIDVPYYPRTVQQTAMDLVARKLTVSEQVDALSLEGALETAGAGDGSSEANQAALGMGEALYDAWLAA